MPCNMTATTLLRSAMTKVGTTYYGGDAPSGGGVPNVSVNAISQDQINISWTAQAGSGIEIQRSTNVAGPFATVAFYPDDETSISLYSHQPATQYYFRARFVDPASVSAYSPIVSGTTTAAVATYHVMTTGNDTTGDGSFGAPFASMQKAVHIATAGDVINVHAGSYTEAATNSSDVPQQYYTTDMGVYFENSGTATAPIVIQAAIGAEGSVIMDQAWGAGGFFFDEFVWSDHIHIKNIEVNRPLYAGVLSHDNPAGDWDDATSLNTNGLVLEGVRVIETADPSDQNVAALRLDSTRGLTVRNCLVDGVYTNGLAVGGAYALNSGAIITYNQYDAVVEYNHFKDVYHGWYVKDPADGSPSYPTVGNRIRYNVFESCNIGVDFNAGSGSETMNETYSTVRSNIFKDVGVAVSQYGEKLTNRVDVYNNFVDSGAGGPTNTATYGVSAADSPSATAIKETRSVGNIFNNPTSMPCTYVVTTDANNRAPEVDYNIFVNGANGQIAGTGLITDLATWQAINNTNIQNPDTNSIINQTLSTLATDAANGDYTIPNGSPAEAFMADGSNAGPYRFGNEQIGVYA